MVEKVENSLVFPSESDDRMRKHGVGRVFPFVRDLERDLNVILVHDDNRSDLSLRVDERGDEERRIGGFRIYPLRAR